MTNQTLHTSNREGARNRAVLFLVLFFWGSVIALASVDPPSDQQRQAFLEKISRIAKKEQVHAGIPASITAAQAIFESNWGNSRLATTGNNYFGIKCKSWWEGETILHQDDDYDENGELTYSCFRAYESIDDSFTDHSVFLLSSERYAPLFELDPRDYKAWAHGLKTCGYATDPKYAQKLIGLIERLNLHALDQADLATEASGLPPEGATKEEAFADSDVRTPPPPTTIPDSYQPTGKGKRPLIRMR